MKKQKGYLGAETQNKIYKNYYSKNLQIELDIKTKVGMMLSIAGDGSGLPQSIKDNTVEADIERHAKVSLKEEERLSMDKVDESTNQIDQTTINFQVIDEIVDDTEKALNQAYRESLYTHKGAQEEKHHKELEISMFKVDHGIVRDPKISYIKNLLILTGVLFFLESVFNGFFLFSAGLPGGLLKSFITSAVVSLVNAIVGIALGYIFLPYAKKINSSHWFKRWFHRLMAVSFSLGALYVNIKFAFLRVNDENASIFDLSRYSDLSVVTFIVIGVIILSFITLKFLQVGDPIKAYGRLGKEFENKKKDLVSGSEKIAETFFAIGEQSANDMDRYTGEIDQQINQISLGLKTASKHVAQLDSMEEIIISSHETVIDETRNYVVSVGLIKVPNYFRTRSSLSFLPRHGISIESGFNKLNFFLKDNESLKLKAFEAKKKINQLIENLLMELELVSSQSVHESRILVGQPEKKEV